jgi:16S rRNA (cytosine1402-N4)-methyltransferase
MIEHYSVLKNEVIDFFKLIESDEEYILDATVGGGGHSYEILKNFPDKKIIGIDKDEYALKRAEERLKEFKGRFILVKSAFKDLDKVLKDLNIEKIAGALFDFGVSHFQLKLERGFSFQREEPLDMRMDTSQDLTAYYVVNYYQKWQLEKILKEYGEEKFYRKIAENIIKERQKNKIQTTKQLADIVYKSYPPKLRHGRIHPATRTFQAIRIEVNKELEEIETGLRKAIDSFDVGGIIQAISFHSLEDRIVKNIFKEYKRLKKLEILTKKPITPTQEEIKENPASRSAKLRVGKRI